MNKSAAATYSLLDNENKSLSGDPMELITLLFDKACSSIKRAMILPIEDAEELDVIERLPIIEDYHSSISKALQIIVALKEMIDMEHGGEVAIQLNETYAAVASSLWKASREKNKQSLGKIYQAVDEIRQGWAGATNSQQQQAELT